MKNLKKRKRLQDREYRKNLGDIYRARQREHFKKYHANNREKERAKCRLYQELKKLERSGTLKSAGNVEYVKQVFSPNGSILRIFTTSNSYFFQLAGFAKALGYTQFNVNSSTLGAALDVKNSDSLLYYGTCDLFKMNGHQRTYLIKFADVENVLNRLINIVNLIAVRGFRQEQKSRELQFEAQRMIEWFNGKILPEFQEQSCRKELFEPIETDTSDKEFWKKVIEKFSDEKSVKYWLDLLRDATVENFSGNILTLGYPERNSSGIIFDNENEQFEKNVSKILGKEIKTKIVWYRNENETEEQKMFEDENAVVEETRNDDIQSEVENNSAEKISLKLPVKVPALTKDDLVDIADRADFVKETFDVNKKDALRAVVLLKSQEINRDLSPLLALLKTA